MRTRRRAGNPEHKTPARRPSRHSSASPTLRLTKMCTPLAKPHCSETTLSDTTPPRLKHSSLQPRTDQSRCTKITAHRCHSPSSDSSTARLTILCTPTSLTHKLHELSGPITLFRSAASRPRGIRVHKTPGSRARWAPMNPVWLRGDDSGTTYLCQSTSGFSTGLGEPGVAGMRNGEFPTDPRLGAGENRLAL